MPDDTEAITKQQNPDSVIGGVSIRAWLAVMLVGTVCLMALFTQVAGAVMAGDLVFEIKEPLYSLSIGAVAYYFGQAQKKPNT